MSKKKVPPVEPQTPAETPAPEVAVPAPASAAPENPIARITCVDFFQGTGGFLSLIPGKGIVLRGKLTYEEWRAALFGLHALRDISQLCVADVINIGRREFGPVLVDEALAQMEFPFAEAKRAETIERVPWEAREFRLEQEHFFAASASHLKPEETKEWLRIAEEQELTPLELRRSIEKGKVVHHENTPAGKGSGSGIVTIYAVRTLYLQWKRNNVVPLLAGPIEEQEEVLEELEPIAELIDKIRENIARAKHIPQKAEK